MRTTFLKAILALTLAVAFLGATATPSRAWWWSSTTEVKASGTYSGLTYWGTFKCADATLVVDGRTYYGSVSKSWTSNTCNATFQNIPVNKSGYLTIRSYVEMFGKQWHNGSSSVWVGKPALTTWQLGTIRLP